MSRPARAVTRLLLTLLALVVALAASVWGGGEIIRRRTFDVPVPRLPPLPTDAASLAHGERLSHVLGCTSCHGPRLEGAVFFREAYVAALVAPNLTQVLPSYSDGELARAIRHGVRRDGRGLFAMPASSLRHLSDRDLAALIAAVRRAPPHVGIAVETSVGPLGYLGLVTGRFAPAPATVDDQVPRVESGTTAGGDLTTRGRYLAHVACGECHGDRLQGGMDGKAPPLAIAAAYTDEAFARLLRTGQTPGERDLYLMDDAARQRFVHLTDEEIAALHVYTRTLASGDAR